MAIPETKDSETFSNICKVIADPDNLIPITRPERPAAIGADKVSLYKSDEAWGTYLERICKAASPGGVEEKEDLIEVLRSAPDGKKLSEEDIRSLEEFLSTCPPEERNQYVQGLYDSAWMALQIKEAENLLIWSCSISIERPRAFDNCVTNATHKLNEINGKCLKKETSKIPEDALVKINSRKGCLSSTCALFCSTRKTVKKILDYMHDRESEPGFHWKGVMASIKSGFNPKPYSQETKLSAADKLIERLQGKEVQFTPNEQVALGNGRLKKLAEEAGINFNEFDKEWSDAPVSRRPRI